PSNDTFLRSFVTRVMYFSLEILCGDEPPINLMDSMQASRGTKFLFISAENEESEVDYNQLFQHEVGARGNLWVMPGVGHTGGYARYPEDYRQQVIQFFTNNLIAPEFAMR